MKKEHSISKAKWIQCPKNIQMQTPFLKALPLKPIGNNLVEYEAQTERGKITLSVNNDCTFLMSNGQIFDDMCEMDILNQPEVLYNVVQRYKNDKIFTYIGPTLIIVNPYRILPQYFSDEVMLNIRNKIIEGQKTQFPHIYFIAGNAFKSMASTRIKQAIVISGESGAGKTQSTKYCMQLLTSLSHKEKHPIQAKILACNPILEAFGNSKTLRNDNSSRFGKYVQIQFANDNTILGANIHSYLLEKSRVVSVSQGERSFHIFYALIASGKKKLEKPDKYRYLSQSNCYEAAYINDKEYFHQIEQAMNNIGFSKQEQERIWQLLSCILQLGNVEFNDEQHKENESKPCLILKKQSLFHLGKCLDVPEEEFEKIMLFEKKKFLKQFTLSPYNKDKCQRNVDTFSKAIYNSIFQFILHKIQLSLKSPSQNTSSINILDIFGFQNFANNSFEQFCINYTNEKLLKLYNQYIFEKQMEILKSDGLDQEVKSIHPPTNDEIINIISGSLSLFSITNDLTMPQQYKDSDIIHGFETQLKSSFLGFDKLNKHKFFINHSQCKVVYSIQGFKQKNQDKVLPEITQIVNKFFVNISKQQEGKTILTKFSKEINSLMEQLQSSKVHFIRCIKPNEKKAPQLIQENYVMAQIRYLGVLETIQIRKKTYPARWIYKEFISNYGLLFPNIQGSSARNKTEKIMKSITKDSKNYLFGSQRVYMSQEIEEELSKKLFQLMKKKVDSAKKIWKSYKKYKFRTQVFDKLKLLAKRIRLWKKLAKGFSLKIEKEALEVMKKFAENKKNLEKKKKAEESQKRKKIQKQEKLQRQEKLEKNKEIELKKKREKCVLGIGLIATKYYKRKFLGCLKKLNILEKQNSYDINETMIADDSRAPYTRNYETVKEETEFQFNKSFLDEKSIYIPASSDVIFEKEMGVPFYTKNHKLQKLRLILSDKFNQEVQEKEEDSYFSPNSEDSEFQLDQTPTQVLNKIIGFPSRQFFKKVLKKRTNFIGMSKNEDEILVAKNRAMSKSLTQMSEDDEIDALRIFKYLVRIGQENKLQKVFKLIEDLMADIQGTSPHVKNQIFLQILKQSNTEIELASVRILQCMSVFLHIYSPDPDFIYAGLQFYYCKMSDKKFTERQTECACYVFKRMLRKLERPAGIAYMPVKYQMIALMCRRKITVPVFLPIGDRVFLNIEPYESFGDLKSKILHEFGINYKRIDPQYFSFFEVVNYDNQEIDQSPIDENDLAWDVVSYWERAKSKYEQNGISPPNFFLMLKVRYVYVCHRDDEETIELYSAQCYFDYFIGRIRLPLEKMGSLAACIKLMKFRQKPLQQCLGSFPTWIRAQVEEEKLLAFLTNNTLSFEEQNIDLMELKFRFISICSECPLAMSVAIPTEQNVKLFLRPKTIFIADKNQSVEEISVKDIIKWAVDEDKLMLQFRGERKTQIIYTQYGKICGSYLSKLPSLVKNKQKFANQSVLNGIH